MDTNAIWDADERAELLAGLRRFQRELRGIVLAAREAATGGLALPAAELEDTIYQIDRVAEGRLLALAERHLAARHRISLVAEGIEPVELGPGREPRLAVIVDPIDGTRPLMHDKRSGWVLTGIAGAGGARLSDIFLAAMTEVPTTRQWRADQYWAWKGGGALGEAEDLLRGGPGRPLRPRPAQEAGLLHGYAQVARFFPGVKQELAAIEEELFEGLLGEESRGRGHVFEDQYASTGGQLHELFTGRDRFVADLRPLLGGVAAARGLGRLLCCHPYDLCVELIAREAGALVEDPGGGPLEAPLDTATDVAWAGYANPRIHALVAPALREVLRRRRLRA